MPVPTATLLLLVSVYSTVQSVLSWGREAWPPRAGRPGDGPDRGWIHFPPTSPLLLNRHLPHPPFLIPRASLAAPCRAMLSPLSALSSAAAAAHAVVAGDGEMRVADGGGGGGAGETGAGLRGGVGGGAVVEDGHGEASGGCSASRGSSARGSSGGDSVSQSSSPFPCLLPTCYAWFRSPLLPCTAPAQLHYQLLWWSGSARLGWEKKRGGKTRQGFGRLLSLSVRGAFLDRDRWRRRIRHRHHR
jgi:hypothetical protein